MTNIKKRIRKLFKRVITTIPFILLANFAQAKPQPAHADLLLRLNRHYYCLYREGLRNLQCELTFGYWEDLKSVASRKFGPNDPRTKGLDQVKFALSYLPPGLWKFNVTPYHRVGDKKFDAKALDLIRGFQNLMRVFTLGWGGMVSNPLFNPENIEKHHCTVDQTAEGFKVSQRWKDSKGKPIRFTLMFDKGEKCTRGDFAFGGYAYSLKPVWEDYPRGWVLKSFEVDVPAQKVREYFDMEYQSPDGLRLPESFSFHEKSWDGKPGPNKTRFEVIFSNHKVNQ